ncbi:hypothetical protein ABDK56_12860 [Sphingomonas sp. ASV193]|uniref:hypothetical protein n=1 Tax=Sphingomonas sp. ASV193 TaxID=3144405 RepID=UPI0032E8B1FA
MIDSKAKGRETMIRCLLVGLAMLGVAAPSFAAPGVNGFAIVNATGKPLSSFAIRRSGGGDWHMLGGGASPGASTKIAYSDPDCGFDLRASAGGSVTVWHGVNLCETTSVTLHLDASGTAWADYD